MWPPSRRWSTGSRTAWPTTVMRTRSRSAARKPSVSSATKRGCGTCWPDTPTSPTIPATPKDRVAAHQDDPTDPWAADDLPAAGWETDRHGNYHQPGLDDLGMTSTTAGPAIDHAARRSPDEELVDQTDREWLRRQCDEHHDADPADHTNTAGRTVSRAPTDRRAQPGHHAFDARSPAAFDRDRAVRSSGRPVPGSTCARSPRRARRCRTTGGGARPRHRPDSDRPARCAPHRTRTDHPGPVPAVAHRRRPHHLDPTRPRPGSGRGGRLLRDPPRDPAGHDRPASRIGVAVQPRHRDQHRRPARPRPHHPAHRARPTRPDRR